jgi:hypothetical protein
MLVTEISLVEVWSHVVGLELDLFKNLGVSTDLADNSQ